jgi:hypothetical protein
MHVREMMRTHPDVKGRLNDKLIGCIEQCYDCAQACMTCADACLAEQKVDGLKQCIRLNLDCADACMAAGSMAARRTGSNEQLLHLMLEICAVACRLCGEECLKHAGAHEHCRICAETCRACEEACHRAAATVH